MTASRFVFFCLVFAFLTSSRARGEGLETLPDPKEGAPKVQLEMTAGHVPEIFYSARLLYDALRGSLTTSQSSSQATASPAPLPFPLPLVQATQEEEIPVSAGKDFQGPRSTQQILVNLERGLASERAASQKKQAPQQSVTSKKLLNAVRPSDSVWKQ